MTPWRAVPRTLRALLLLLASAPATGVGQSRAVDPRAGAVARQQEAVPIDLLDTSLKSLADHQRHSRRVGGYVLLGLGAGMAVGGVTTLALSEGHDADLVAYSLIGGGVGVGALSLVPFTFASEAEGIYRAFDGMPAETPGQVRQKYLFGERRFESLAEGKRRRRVATATANIMVGVLGIALSEPSQPYVFPGPILFGVISLLIPSEEERRYESYLRAREELRGG